MSEEADSTSWLCLEAWLVSCLSLADHHGEGGVIVLTLMLSTVPGSGQL